MRQRGATRSTVGIIADAAEVTRSQFYRHFTQKADVIDAVIALHVRQLVDRQRTRVGSITTLDALWSWRDEIVATSGHGHVGSDLGALAHELANHAERYRLPLSEAFGMWQACLEECLRRLQDDHVLSADADVRGLATGLIAALYGGMLLARTTESGRPLSVAVDMAFERIRMFVATGDGLPTTDPAAAGSAGTDQTHLSIT